MSAIIYKYRYMVNGTIRDQKDLWRPMERERETSGGLRARRPQREIKETKETEDEKQANDNATEEHRKVE